ncbi:hypothetical protein T10_33 [Trichinella papuae]|uniref:Uncharacterized protein n=1 Tax=Trichinella papuae TaxID=268474 RepID=A0A0V1MI58_9BILA|nr:hypothetical protein T10_33 [Trichinella papuae]
MFFLKFISFTAFITWQFSTAAAKVDEQLNAPSYAKLIDVLERSQSGNTVTYNVKASSSTCLLSDKVNKNPNFYIKFVMKTRVIDSMDILLLECSVRFPVKKCIVTITDESVEKGTAQCEEIDFSMEHFEPLNMLNKTQRKYVMPRLKYILQDTAEDNEYDVYRKIKSVDSVSQSGHVTKVQLTVTETNCPVKGENIYYGWSLQKNCDDMKKPYKCTILYIASNKRSAKVDCAEKSSITGYTVLHNCPKRFPVMTCTLTITGKSMETGSVECEEIHLSKAHFTRITPPYDYLMREIKNKAESILFEMDSEKESGVYKKLTSIDAALQFGSVKKIQLTAADTDCKVAGENAYTGVLVADDCHELLALHQYTIVYVDSPYAALLSCAQAAKMIII